jgi:hypothetical protein
MRLTRAPADRLGIHPRPGRSELPSAADQAEIFNRLEVTKRYGLVADYLVSWSGLAGQHTAKVTVWGKDDTPTDVVQHYIARLLKGLVPDRQIHIAAN